MVVNRGSARSRRLDRIWYENHPLSLALAPLGWLFLGAVWVRQQLYRKGVLAVKRLTVPVIVVGNITAGGTGKTPLVAWIARFLAQSGYRPGIVCRGYGGRSSAWPQAVRAESDPASVGDESVVLARRAHCPVAAGPDRYEAAHALVDGGECDVVICDDGLQHLRLGRDIEIAVVDGVRRHGNRRLLPAGPLREPVSRMRSVHLVVANDGAQPGEFEMLLSPWMAINLLDNGERRRLETFGGEAVHAVCGIGHPNRFFRMLESRGLHVLPHVFADHHCFRARDIEFDDDRPVLMTEKDAVKCQRLAGARHWYVPVRAELQPAFADRLLALLERLPPPERTS